MRRPAALALCIMLAACGNAREQQEVDAREVMMSVVTKIVADAYPDLFALTPVAECIIDNATEEEQLNIVQSALQGVSGRDTAMVLEISRRPETRTCIAAAGVRL